MVQTPIPVQHADTARGFETVNISGVKQGSHSFGRKKIQEFSSPILKFSRYFFGHSSQPKYIKYETFITDVHHSFFCNMN